MNWVDILILLMIVWFTYAAFHAGMIREVITIFGAIFAVALAGLFYKELAPDIHVAIKDEPTAQVVAFGIIFGAVVLATQLLAVFLKQASSLLMLGIFDALGGAIIGLMKAFVFIEIGLIAAITFPALGLGAAVDNSALAPFFLNLLPILKAILPQEFKNAIDAF